MLIAVPSVTTILTNNKKQSLINDAKKFIALAQQEARKSSYKYSCYTLNQEENENCYTIHTQDVEKSPYDIKYLESSRVLQCPIGGNYYYIVYLTDGQKSIEGAIQVANKDKNALGNFKDINDSSNKRFAMITDYNEKYTLTCK